MKRYLNESVYGLKRSAIREFSKAAAGVPDCIRFTLGEPDFDTPAAVCKAAMQSIENGDTHYINNNGAADLLAEISTFEKEKNGLCYGTDEIIVTAGATEALFVSLLGILNPGDEVIIPTPAFLLYEEIVHLCRGVTVPLDTSGEGFQIRKESLEPLITEKTKAIVLNSPNNPTGCVYDAESLRTVYELVKGKPIFVICDDVYRQLCYTDDYHSFAEFSDLKPQILVVQSFSKPYAMTGWRMGYLMADRDVKERLELVHQYAVVSTPSLFQNAGIAALAADPGEMVREYEWRRNYVTGRLTEIGLEFSTPEGAFYVFPSIEQFGLDSMSFAKRLLFEKGLAVTPGVAFGADSHVRISYSCSRETLQKGMDRLEAFIRDLQKQGL